MRNYVCLLLLLVFAMLILAGCGETVNGVGKDIKRIQKGIKTVFVRDTP